MNVKVKHLSVFHSKLQGVKVMYSQRWCIANILTPNESICSKVLSIEISC